MLINESDLG